MLAKIDENAIAEATRRLHEAAPRAEIILLGSQARGDNRPDSDADFLVIEPEVKARRDEVVRLLDVLRSLRIPVDIMVTSAEIYQKWSDTPGTIYYEAKQEGKVLHAGQ